MSRKGIVRSVEESLQRLQVTCVEMLLLHDPDAYYREAFKVAFPTLVDLRRQGVVKAIGAGMNQWHMLADFARLADPDCLLLAGQYTLLDQEALAEFLSLCQARGISVLLAGVNYKIPCHIFGTAPCRILRIVPLRKLAGTTENRWKNHSG